jgi:hypothetical protein
MKNLTISKEKVIEAANKCNEAKKVLEILFPQAFKLEILFPQAFKKEYIETIKLHNGKSEWINSGKDFIEMFVYSSISSHNYERILNGKEFDDFYERFCKWMNDEIAKNS